MNVASQEILKKLSILLKKHKAQALLVPSTDRFLNEYVPAPYRYLECLTGFSGSNGCVLVLENEVHFFTDGRYTLQAKNELPDTFICHNLSDSHPSDIMSCRLQEGDVCLFDPWLHTHKEVERYQAILSHKKIVLRAINETVLPELCALPLEKSNPAKFHLLKFSGCSLDQKKQKLLEAMDEQQADCYVIGQSESVCWLLNIRGNDIPSVPVILSYAVLEKNGVIRLYIDSDKVKQSLQRYFDKHEVLVRSKRMLKEDLQLYARKNQIVMMDPLITQEAFYGHLSGVVIKSITDPCIALKAVKNTIEQAGARACHIRDGAALTKCLYWIDTHAQPSSLSEQDIDEQLIALRAEQAEFQEPSFNSIVGFGSHGAIVHYRVTPSSNRYLKGSGLLLIDSGGQYLGGTTDVTRTISIGRVTEEQKRCFTLVLKGHIALARCVFPEGTSGEQLDVLARYALWQNGLDYEHGTGHGVGSYLSVHEGPQRIGKRGASVALKEGMILSNEPGYYLEGAFGIRIESLVLVTLCKKYSTPKKKYFHFEVLTQVPIDTRLITWSYLTEDERQWLRQYQKHMMGALKKHLTSKELEWLKRVSSVPKVC